MMQAHSGQTSQASLPGNGGRGLKRHIGGGVFIDIAHRSPATGGVD